MRRILKSYLFWTYPRGSFHYDVMVTLILAFIFVSPILINYHDRPQETLTSSNGVVVKTSGTGVLIYEIGAEEIGVGTGAAALKTKLLDRIQAISGRVEMDRYSERRDASGRVTDYRVWAHRPE